MIYRPSGIIGLILMHMLRSSLKSVCGEIRSTTGKGRVFALMD